MLDEKHMVLFHIMWAGRSGPRQMLMMMMKLIERDEDKVGGILNENKCYEHGEYISILSDNI